MLSNTLASLEETQLIRRAPYAPELEYLFKHVLIQETVYDSLLNRDRRRLHAAVAGTLERSYPEAADALAGLLARHWDDAGDAERAFGYYVRAGDGAARLNANSEALMAFDRAVALVPELALSSAELAHVFDGRGRTLELRGEYDAALANFETEAALGRARQDSALELDALIHRTTLYITPNKLHDLDKALALSESALELARAAHDRAAEAKVLWNMLLLNNFAGDAARAVEYGEASLRLARELQLKEQLAYTLNDLAWPYLLVGREQDAIAVSSEAEGLWRELNNLPMLANNLTNLGSYAIYSGQYASSIPSVSEAQRIAHDIGNLWGEAYASETLGFIYFELGELDKALHALLDSAEIGARGGFRDPEYTARAIAAYLYAQVGAPQKGLEVLAPAIEYPAPEKSWMVAPYAVQGILYILLDDLSNAKRALDAGAESFNGTIDSPAPFVLGIAQTLYHLARGDPATALEIMTQQLEILRQSRIRSLRTVMLNVNALALAGVGQTEQAVHSLLEGVREAEETGSRSALWETYGALARLYRGQGDTKQADEYTRLGREQIQFILAHLAPDLHAAFLNRPEARALFQ